MISLLSIAKRFLRVVRSGWDDPEFRGLSIVLGSWVALGTIIYTVYEEWNLAEAFYFSVITLTTIGYGDYTPTSTEMQIYTAVYAVLGIGLFVAFNASLARFALRSRLTDPDATDDG